MFPALLIQLVEMLKSMPTTWSKGCCESSKAPTGAMN
jgi:hypothetical protein